MQPALLCLPSVVEVSSDDNDISVVPEAPEEDANVQLGKYSILFSNKKINYCFNLKTHGKEMVITCLCL